MTPPFDAVMKRIRYRKLPGREETTEPAVQLFERGLGYPLPTDYRSFLLHYGLTAGRGTKFTPPTKPGEASSVGAFYGLTPNHNYDLEAQRETYSADLPAHYLPIASGSGGQFLLSLTGENAGAVFWWFPEEGEVTSEEDLEPIAESFTAFMNALTAEEV
jgi:hypothetical protein